MKDTLFLDPGRRKSSFAFDESVTAVFDDMLKRSIPFYFEIQNMIADLVEKLAPAKGKVCDLGCSTGTTIALLSSLLQKKSLIYEGIDNSVYMLQRADRNLSTLKNCRYTLHERDLNEGISIENADVAIMNLTMQFVKPENRRRLLRDIYSGLKQTGSLILVEKVTVGNEKLNELFIDAYHQFKKRNLYTDMEIAAKRKALENILVPNGTQENRRLLQEAGFGSVEIFFNWFNFCGLIAVKD